jgi:hypothetical protein
MGKSKILLRNFFNSVKEIKKGNQTLLVEEMVLVDLIVKQIAADRKGKS